MSSAASTVPGKPNLFHKNRSRSNASKDEVKNQQNTSKATNRLSKDDIQEEIKNKVANSHPKQKDVSEKKTNSKVNGNGKSWMEKNKNKLGNETKPSQNRKPDFRWMPKPQPAADSKQIKIISIPEYQEMVHEIENLRERCFSDGAKISELQEEKSKLLGEFDTLYEENATLRKKLHTGNQPYTEPYARVFEDRNILRDSEEGYKKRINRLEQEHREARKEVDKLTNELKSLRAKQSSKSETPSRESVIYHLNTQIQKLKTDNQKLSAQIKIYNEHQKPASRSSSHTDQVMNPRNSRRVKSGILKKDEMQNHVNNHAQTNHLARKPNVRQKTETTEKPKPPLPAKSRQPPLRQRRDIKKQGEEISPYDDAQFATFNPERETHFDYEYVLPDSDLQDW